MRNVQISFDEDLLEEVDLFAESAQLSRSAAVREALKAWLRRKRIEAFEKEWIRKLEETPPDDHADDAWLDAESWSEE